MPTKAEYRRRMLKHAAFLETLPDERFDMACIVKRGTRKWNGLPSCGTAACLAGWLPHVFPDLASWRSVADCGARNCSYVVTADGKHEYWYQVAGVVFGLDSETAMVLTDEGAAWQTPKAAAAALRHLAKTGELPS